MGVPAALALLACTDGAVALDAVVEETASPGETLAPPPNVRINEVQSHAPDWVEVFNASNDAVDLAGWRLAQRPLDGVLQPGEFRAFPVDGVSSDGETVSLEGPDGPVDELDVPPLPEGTSYGVEQAVVETVLVDTGDAVEWSLDGETWSDGTMGVGFDGLDPDATPIDVASGALTDQSTDGWGRTGPEAVDGNPATFTHTNTADFQPWWRVDLDGWWRVGTVRLHNRADCCPERLYNITVEALGDDDDVLWASEVLNPTTDTPVDPGALLEVHPDTDARHLRVRKEAVGGTYESEWLSLAEVEVLAVPTSGLADRLQTPLDHLPERVTLRAAFQADPQDRLVLELHEPAEAWLNGVAVQAGAVDPGLLQGENLLEIEATAQDGVVLAWGRLVSQTLEHGGLAYFEPGSPDQPNGSGFAGYVAAPTTDVPRGLLDQAVTVNLTTETPDATIWVTTDGSAPGPDNGVELDQLDVQHTTLLRAMATGDGYRDSPVVTFSYLLIPDILAQPAAPDGLPTTWDGLSQSPIGGDYEMDPDVVGPYADDLVAGLRDIPVLSVVAEHDAWWGPTGIYENSQQRGRAWEREMSIEFIEPDGRGFQEQAGVRIHGYGWRPHSNSRKHSLRLEFRSDYGATKLEYPLFPDAPVDRFDSIVLRAQGSRSWQDFRDPEQALYVRDSFARDTARDMGKDDGHATYVHLFINGLYWGLYNPVERPDADFGAERFGGDADDYDAINRRTTTNEAIDGTLDAYNALLALADGDVSDLAPFEEVLHLEDLVDYMLIHQYTANRDGPEQFSSNNMRGVRNRDGGLWRWFVWDMEYSLWGAQDHINIDVDVAGSISHVYARLRNNADFRTLYAARAREHLTGDGALTVDACIARFEARTTQIERAVVAESARWGDTDRATPYTRDVEWETERQRLLTEFFPYRTEVLIEQLTAAGLY